MLSREARLQQVPQLQLRRLLALRPLSPEAREPWGALNAGDTTATEAAGAPPQDAAKEELQHGTTSTYTGASSSAPPTTTTAGRPEAPAGHSDPPQDHPSGPTTSPERADAREADSGEVPLPPPGTQLWEDISFRIAFYFSADDAC